MTIDHGAEPTQDHPVALSLDYALSDTQALIGYSPDQRYEDMRRQLLAGPLKHVTATDVDTSEAPGPNVSMEMTGNHHFNPETGEVSGTITLTGVIAGHNRMRPEEMLAAARPHFANALAQDMEAGLGKNLAQHASQDGGNADSANCQHSANVT